MSRPTTSASDSPQRVVRYAEQLAESSEWIFSKDGHPNIRLVKKDSVSSSHAFCTYSCGEPLLMHSPHKVIMLVGATGTGKSTLINAMTNYTLGVKWDDDFRLKLVQEHVPGAKSQAHSQTQKISSYTLHRNEQNYSLTIIDTPGFGDTRGIERDKAIVDQIREFFFQPEAHGVDHIDAVGFVVKASEARLTPTQTHIFDSILGLFGKDIKPNILLLVTHWDGSKPAVLAAIKEAEIPYSGCVFKFNNAALFTQNKPNKSESDSDGEEEVSPHKLYWQTGMKETKKFFQKVSELETKSLTLSQEVLQNRKELEQRVEMLQKQSGIYKVKMQELQKQQEQLIHFINEKHENKHFKCETQGVEYVKKDTAVGSLNCDSCQYTCHYPCRQSNATKKKCCMMDRKGYCKVCPQKCYWNAHVIQNHKHIYRKTEQTKTVTFDDIERRYRDPTERSIPLTVDEVVNHLQSETEAWVQAEAALTVDICNILQRLDQIALKPHLTSLNDYIDVMIENEQREAKAGWQDTVKRLQSLKSQQGLLDKLKSKYAFGKEVFQKVWSWVLGGAFVTSH